MALVARAGRYFCVAADRAGGGGNAGSEDGVREAQVGARLARGAAGYGAADAGRTGRGAARALVGNARVIGKLPGRAVLHAVAGVRGAVQHLQHWLRGLAQQTATLER